MKLDSLDPDFRNIVEQVIAEVSAATGLEWIATSCTRTIAGQNKLYAQGRTAPGQIVTRAKGGQSPHNFRLAVDCAPMHPSGDDIWWNAPEGYWEAYGAIAKEHGLTWGGSFTTIVDRPHIESPSWKMVQALWRDGKVEIA
jgi:peptidoglycan L-alanyl-D-glutamate endopeptidase CwlK